MIRVSRPCYNKYHRCPGWAGGGIRLAKTGRCDGGYVKYPAGRLWKWRFSRCPKCRVIVLPYMIRWLDWRYIWAWKIRIDLRRWLQDHSNRED